jgi:hypothetical protein
MWSVPPRCQTDLAVPFFQEGIIRVKPCGASVYGIDLGKSTFHVVGNDANGHLVRRVTLGRQTIFHFFANASTALIGMEAWPWLTVARQAACRDGACGKDHSCSICEALR